MYKPRKKVYDSTVKTVVGRKLGMLTIVDIKYKRYTSKNKTRWMIKCICDCGNIWIGQRGQLRQCPNFIKNCGCKDYGVAHLNSILFRYKKGAEKRKYEWSITDEQARALLLSNCFYCNAQPSKSVYKRNYNGVTKVNGIDRIENTVGYTILNLVSCCTPCNYAKGILTVKAFTNKIKRIYNYLNLSEDYNIISMAQNLRGVPIN